MAKNETLRLIKAITGWFWFLPANVSPICVWRFIVVTEQDILHLRTFQAQCTDFWELVESAKQTGRIGRIYFSLAFPLQKPRVPSVSGLLVVDLQNLHVHFRVRIQVAAQVAVEQLPPAVG